MADKQKFYITTAISYPNGAPHIGHAYEIVASDAIARFKRIDGYDVFFMTGTDEHGLKIQQTADRNGTTPKAFVDEMAAQVPGHGRPAGLLLRPLHPHHRCRSPALDPGALAPDAGEGRHLSLQVFRLVLGPGRGLLRRERADEAARRQLARADAARRSNGSRRRAISSASPPIRTGCSRITRPIRTSSARRPAATRSSASSAPACRISRSAAPPSTGACRCRAIRSTSCTCGSTR